MVVIADELHCTRCFEDFTEAEFAQYLTDAGCVEPECTCRLTGDVADASECELHGFHRRIPQMADQETAETLSLLAKSGCSPSEAVLWMSIIEGRVA